jgi:hypothetical protein
MLQHAAGTGTPLRRHWLAVCQAGRPVGDNLLAYTRRQIGMTNGEKRPSSRGLLALAGAAGLVCIVSLLWYSLRSPADKGGTAAWQTPVLPASSPPAVSATSTPMQTATAAEAQSVITQLRTRFERQRITPTAVRQLQTRLKAVGFPPGPIDGVMGPQTRHALRQFQEAHGLDATGELNGTTRTALGL